MRELSAQVMSEPNEVLHAGEVYVFPASYAQKRMWFLERLEPGSAAYHMPFALRLSGPLAVTALRQDLDAVFHRH